MEKKMIYAVGKYSRAHRFLKNFRAMKSIQSLSCILLGFTLLCGSLTWAPDSQALAAEGDNPYQVEVGHYGMTPIYGRDLEDGTYEISVDSTSNFFKIVEGKVTVDGDQMTGSIEIGSHSYLYIYLGTKEEAEAAAESEYILPEEKEDSYVYAFDLEALDKPINCAAYSKRKKKWYDRRILFDATSLPEGTVKFELPDYEAIEEGLKGLNASASGDSGEAKETGSYGGAAGDAYTPGEAVSVNLPDGEYSIDVSMTGGTGRATISSPTYMIVKDGKAYAKLLMSSSHYDWMIAAGVTYMNENSDGGNSTFTIPITAMDTLVNIIADTTAMGDPVAIEYTLTFYAETIGNKGQIPQEAAKKVLIVAIFIIVAGGILNHFTKRKRRKSKSSRRKRR